MPYYRVGRGPDVFFVHGWPLHAATFRDIVPKLADRFTCHLIDLPGAGDSEWGPQSKISVRDHADSVRSVIQQIGLQDFAFVAHDSGAVFAQLVAADMSGVRGLCSETRRLQGTTVGKFSWGSRIRRRRVPEGVPRAHVEANGQWASAFDAEVRLVGYRACDLASTWLLFEDAAARGALLDAYAPEDTLLLRARAWAVALGATLLDSGLANSRATRGDRGCDAAAARL